MTIEEFAKENAGTFASMMFPVTIDKKANEIKDKYEANLISWITELITEWEKTK